VVDVTLRGTKGSPLTHDEVDANFTNLKTAVEANVADIATNVADIATNASSLAEAGGVSVYATIDDLPMSGNSNGDLALVSSTNRLYIFTNSGWYNIALVNQTPTISGNSAAYELAIDGTPTVITLSATDPEGVPITWSHVATGLTNEATVTNVDNVFTITPSTDSANAGEFSITFRASDGVNIGTAASEFTLVFLNALWKDAVLSIGTSSTDGLDNSTFIDRSSNAHTVTTEGTPIQTAFHPYLENWSVEFDDAVTGSLKYNYDTAINVGSGDYTIELWCYAHNLNTHDAIFNIRAGDSGFGFLFRKSDASGNWEAYTGNGSPDIAFTDSASPLNAWVHHAFVRINGTLKWYINGVEELSQANSATWSTYTQVQIGNYNTAYTWPGYISNLRIVKGTGVYTGAFTPPTEKLTAISGTVLLACNSNRFDAAEGTYDSYAVAGTAKISAFNPFGQESEYAVGENKGSNYFDGGASGKIEAASSSTLDFAGDFTIQFWVYFESFGNFYRLFDRGGVATSNNISLFLENTAGAISTHFNSGSTRQTSSNGVVRLYEWIHIAFARSGSATNNCSVYVNGAEEITFTSTAVINPDQPLTLGNINGLDRPLNGYMSDFYVTSQTALYTANFTPPTAPVENTGATLYLPMDNAGIFDKTGNNTLTLVGDTSTSTTQTKFADTAIYFDGSGDYLSAPFNDRYNFGTNDFTIEFWVNQPSLTSSGDIDVIAHYGIVGGTRWGVSFDNRSTNGYPYLRFAVFTNTTQTINVLGAGTSGWSANTWYHIAVVRSGNDFKLFRDGIQNGGTVTDADAVPSASPSTSSVFTLGSEIGGAPVNAYIENLQILKGVAKYTSNFTVPDREQGRTYQAES